MSYHLLTGMFKDVVDMENRNLASECGFLLLCRNPYGLKIMRAVLELDLQREIELK